MDSVSVERDVVDVEAHTTQVLLSHDSLLGGPLEASHDGVLDFIEVLDSLGAVHHEVGAGSFGTEAPDLTGLSDVVFVLVGKVTGTGLEVITGVYAALMNKKNK